MTQSLTEFAGQFPDEVTKYLRGEPIAQDLFNELDQLVKQHNDLTAEIAGLLEQQPHIADFNQGKPSVQKLLERAVADAELQAQSLAEKVADLNLRLSAIGNPERRAEVERLVVLMQGFKIPSDQIAKAVDLIACRSHGQ